MNTTQLLIEHASTLSYGGIFILSLIASVVVPVPEEISLLFIGYGLHTSHHDMLLVIPVVMAGLLISDSVIYFLSRQGNKYIEGFYNRIFKNRLEHRKEWLEENVNKVIFFSRFLVQLRFLGPFFAGQTKVSWKTFLTYELVALIIYAPLVVGAGWFFHSSINHIISGINVVRDIVLIAVAGLILYSLYESFKKKIYGKKK
jgi:membrane protein DedA with SNARE-associated domain